MKDQKRYSPDLEGAKKEDIFYALTMFPYPSGIGLHCGHASVMTINDVVARYQRMQGKTVFQPFGFDAFGLPTENYAMKVGKPAYEVTEENKKNFIHQLQALNMSFDRERMIDTSKPDYYKWTQWIFEKLYKAGLVYRDNLRVNRCPDCQTVLANDQVVEGQCERCKHEIKQKKMPQWFIKITDYADRLLEDLDLIDWPEETKIGQRNWIGRKTGINIEYQIDGYDDKYITCFTTRPDTNFGATFVVLAPDSDYIGQYFDIFPNKAICEKYIKEALAKTKVQRMQDARKKTGVDTGLFVINNLNSRKMPLYIGDFVLADVGTGAVVGVPGHDLRDFEFAQTVGIDIIRVVVGLDGDESDIISPEQVQEDAGHMIHSEFLDGLEIMEAKERIIDYLEEQGWGERVVNYKLRDRSVSRQRYWGSPIPVWYTFEDNEKVPFFPYSVPEYKIRTKLPIVFRLGSIAIIKHPTENKFLGLQHKNMFDHISFPGGGVEDGATLEETAIKEAREETGYKNFKVVGVVDQEIHSMFYAPHKGENRYTIQYGVILALEDLEQGTKHLMDHDKYDLVWIDKSEILEKIYYGNQRYLRAQYYAPDQLPVCEMIDKYNAYHPHPDHSKWVPHLIPESELPVELPLDLEVYKPKGKSPLADHPEFPWYKMKSDESNEVGGKKTVLLIHGRGNRPGDGSCLDGVARTLEEQGCKVIYEHVPYEQECNFDATMKKLLQYDVDMVVGHSAGGYLAMQYAQHKQVDHALMIAPSASYETWSQEFTDKLQQVNRLGPKGYDGCVAFHQEKIDSTKLSGTNLSFFYGENDSLIDKYTQNYYKNILPGAYVEILPGRGHMGDSEGREVEELNEYLRSQLSDPNLQVYRRECDTLDTFMCSSFYFLRYPDAHNPDELIKKELADKMFPVDFYSGGKEHTVGHLLYSRFIHKFLFDQGYVPSPEPFQKLVHQGMVLGADGRKMGKRYGNGVDPIEVVEKYGADAVRTYLMFMGPVEQDKTWNDNSLNGVAKFLKRIEAFVGDTQAVSGSQMNIQIKSDEHMVMRANEKFIACDDDAKNKRIQEVISLLHQTIQGVTHDIEKLKLNTVVSKFMIFVNTIYEQGVATREILEGLALLIAPYATELAEKIWQKLGHEEDIHFAKRPIADESKILISKITLPIQINGKVRAKREVDAGMTEDEAVSFATGLENINKWIEGKEIKKVIWVQDKILNLIVSEEKKK